MSAAAEERPFEKLVQDLSKQLAGTGSVMAWADVIEVQKDEWRKAARAAAVGRKVRTVDSGSVLYAWLPDWPVTDEEREIADRRMQEAVRMLPSMFEPRTISLRDSDQGFHPQG